MKAEPKGNLIRRWDSMLQLITLLASSIANLIRHCDGQLNRLIDCTSGDAVMGYMCNPIEDLHLELYSDGGFFGEWKHTTDVLRQGML